MYETCSSIYHRGKFYVDILRCFFVFLFFSFFPGRWSYSLLFFTEGGSWNTASKTSCWENCNALRCLEECRLVAGRAFRINSMMVSQTSRGGDDKFSRTALMM